jgi:hypothetical protein
MRLSFAVAAALLAAAPAWAKDPVGCDNFKWPVARERAALAAPNLPRLAPGGDFPATLPAAATLVLQPADQAKLPKEPERAPKPATFAGFTTIAAIPAAGVYSVSLSVYGWVDVVQNGAFLKPKGFSGVTGCDGIRKTMTFDLAAGPALIQISGVTEPAVTVAVAPRTE